MFHPEQKEIFIKIDTNVVMKKLKTTIFFKAAPYFDEFNHFKMVLLIKLINFNFNLSIPKLNCDFNHTV